MPASQDNQNAIADLIEREESGFVQQAFQIKVRTLTDQLQLEELTDALAAPEEIVVCF
ncbi:hypothetical protein [Pseudomonas taeanensis]|uniref:hypothetical protein n=1 Tax=Pseudomonas taeanensis TaxID=574962 RepID=UPI0004B664EA|nr:hypothetical protein [Pseudomonas taeanensis]